MFAEKWRSEDVLECDVLVTVPSRLELILLNASREVSFRVHSCSLIGHDFDARPGNECCCCNEWVFITERRGFGTALMFVRLHSAGSVQVCEANALGGV